MKWHPAIVMAWVWGLCALTFLVLPFQIETRTVTFFGFVLLALFIATFVAGALTASPVLPKRTSPYTKRLDLSRADRVIQIVAMIAIVAQLIDIASGNVLTLTSAFQDRDERAVGVLRGELTGGSLAFQFAFLTYPIGYCAIVREILFRQQVNIKRLGVLGFTPVVLAAIGMGGRGPILYAIAILALALQARRGLFPAAKAINAPNRSARRLVLWALAIIGIGIAMNYFVNVFIARADVAGGIDQMQRISAVNWGVSFDGPGSSVLREVIGDGNTFLVYVFIWYLVQGLVISNVIFTEYNGGMTFGIYGIDLGSAIVRRIDPQFVSNKFTPLLDINVYGFLPNAFGSLYVDLWFFAFIPIFFWGIFCGYAYRKVHTSSDARWVFVAPFITMGIFFSLINTPLGFGNGFVTHLWMLAVIFLIRPIEGNSRSLQHGPQSA